MLRIALFQAVYRQIPHRYTFWLWLYSQGVVSLPERDAAVIHAERLYVFCVKSVLTSLWQGRWCCDRRKRKCDMKSKILILTFCVEIQNAFYAGVLTKAPAILGIERKRVALIRPKSSFCFYAITFWKTQYISQFQFQHKTLESDFILTLQVMNIS